MALLHIDPRLRNTASVPLEPCLSAPARVMAEQAPRLAFRRHGRRPLIVEASLLASVTSETDCDVVLLISLYESQDIGFVGAIEVSRTTTDRIYADAVELADEHAVMEWIATLDATDGLPLTLPFGDDAAIGDVRDKILALDAAVNAARDALRTVINRSFPAALALQ